MIFLLPLVLPADTTISETDKFAWSTNSGWVNFAPNPTDGVFVGEAYLSGYAWSSNTGWITFGDGAPTNGHTYSNTGNDHGVNHDGLGNLSGYAWDQNTGWLNLDWATLSNPNRPRINLTTGAFEGYAWSPNLGWVNLSTGLLTTLTMGLVDSDNDGIDDSWEWKIFGNLETANETSDFDHDGSSDLKEYLAKLPPDDATFYPYFKLLTVAPSKDFVTFELVVLPGRHYKVYSRTDLNAGAWTPIVSYGVQYEAAILEDDHAYPASDTLFLILEAIRPLSD